MRDLQKITEECIKKLKDIDIPIQDNTIVEISFKRIQGFGKCLLTSDKMFLIRISSSFEDENSDIDELIITVLHEVLHTCDGALHHSKRWYEYAKLVQSAYGYNLIEFKTIYDIKHKKKAVLGKMLCTNCPSYWYVREKKPWNLIQSGLKCYCQFCGGEMKIDADWNSRMSEEGEQQCEFCYSWMEKI